MTELPQTDTTRDDKPSKQRLIAKLQILEYDMEVVAVTLAEYGELEHAKEVDDAKEMVTSWIEEISND